MARLTKGEVASAGLLSAVKKFIEEWEPGTLGNEKAYRDSLLKSLRATVPEDCRVEREYRHGGTTEDLYVSWKGLLFNAEIFIEMKYNLQKKASFDRLIGQLEEMGPGKRKIVLALVGKTDEGLLSRLKERYKDIMETATLMDEASLAIVVKR